MFVPPIATNPAKLKKNKKKCKKICIYEKKVVSLHQISKEFETCHKNDNYKILKISNLEYLTYSRLDFINK